MERSTRWQNRLKAMALGLALALTALTIRHAYETFWFGHPLCENCRPDFASLYSGARLVWEKRAALYDLDHQLAIQKSVDARIGDSVLAFAYPPTTALLLMPLGWLSFGGAYLLMIGVSALALILTLGLLSRDLQLNREQRTWLLLTTACSFGVHSAVLQGQTSLVLLLLLSLFARAARRGDQAASGWWSGALFLKPQVWPVPFLVLMARRRWRAVMIALLAVSALAIVSVVTVGFDAMVDYFHLARRFSASETDLGTNPRSMHNLRALLFYGLSVSVIAPAWVALTVLIASGVLLLNLKPDTDQLGTSAQWIGNLSAIALLSPHLHAHDLAIFVLANAFVLKLWHDCIPLAVSSVLVASGIYPLLPWVLPGFLPPVLPVVFLILFTGCVWIVRRNAARY